jgi:hypothetical protein
MVAVPSVGELRHYQAIVAMRAGAFIAAIMLVLAPEPAHAQARAASVSLTTVPLGAPAPSTAIASADDVEGPPRLSLPTEADRDAWKRSGFRLGLGIVYGRLFGLKGAPSGRLIGANIRLGLRLDADWSILASFQYALASATGGLSGLRFAGTIDPTWHVTSHLSLGLGLGFGGIVEGSPGRPDISPLPNTLGASYTEPSPGPPLPSCSGVGVAGLARAEWAIILGSRAATTLGIEGIGQWTGCIDDTGLVEPDTGQSVVRRQWWPHLGVTGTWGIMWR